MDFLSKLSSTGIVIANLIISLIALTFVFGAPVETSKKYERNVWGLLLIAIAIKYATEYLKPLVGPKIVALPFFIEMFGNAIFAVSVGILSLSIYSFHLKKITASGISVIIGLAPYVYILFCVQFNRQFSYYNTFSILNLAFYYFAFMSIAWKARKVDITSALVITAYAHLQSASLLIDIYGKYWAEKSQATVLGARDIFLIYAAVKLSMIGAVYKILGIKGSSD